MEEKELRLALVCYGGASLAIYMHGITKEILKLLRASAAYHAIPSVRARATARYEETAPPRPDHLDSEEIYFDLFRHRRYRGGRLRRRHQRRHAVTRRRP